MSEYWVGSIGRAIFVFDREIQPAIDAELTLFSYSFDRPVKLDRTIVRCCINRCHDAELIALALRRYENWRKFYRSELEPINAGAAFDTDAFIQRAQSENLILHWGRAASCYSCGDRLFAKRGTVCEKCFWIKCDCGACGCERNRR
jgi:hypothetical protein